MLRRLTAMVLLAMVLGAAFGLACHAYVHDPATLKAITGWLGVLTTVFLRAIRMIIAPLIFATLVSGVGRMGGSAGSVGRVALGAMAWFILASLAALAIAFAVVEILAPGAGLHLKAGAVTGAPRGTDFTAAGFITHLVPTSLADAMATNQVLQIVVFALVAGVALGRIGEKGAPILALTDSIAALVLRMTSYVMLLAPFGVFGAVATALAQQGTAVIAHYASYVGGFYVALAGVWAAMLAASGLVLGRARLAEVLRAGRSPSLIALTTASSEAAYPSLLQNLEEAGLPNRIVGFVLPLGYSFNLVGSMSYCAFAALFVAQAYDVALAPGQIVQLLLLLLVASKGIANVPRAAVLVVATAFPYFNLPDAGVLLILGVDHFLDMGRTATNVMSNALAAACVAKWEDRAPAAP